MSDIPEKIFLCFGEDGPNYRGPLSWGDVIWADEPKHDTDIEYIKYDSYRQMQQELRTQIKYLISENSLTKE